MLSPSPPWPLTCRRLTTAQSRPFPSHTEAAHRPNHRRHIRRRSATGFPTSRFPLDRQRAEPRFNVSEGARVEFHSDPTRRHTVEPDNGTSGQLSDAVDSAKQKTEEQAGQIVESGRGALRNQIDQRSTQAGRQAQSVADSLRDTATQMRIDEDRQKQRCAVPVAAKSALASIFAPAALPSSRSSRWQHAPLSGPASISALASQASPRPRPRTWPSQ